METFSLGLRIILFVRKEGEMNVLRTFEVENDGQPLLGFVNRNNLLFYFLDLEFCEVI